MDVDAFDVDLPPELIAQEPLPQRDASRLLVLRRDRSGALPGAVPRVAGAAPGEIHREEASEHTILNIEHSIDEKTFEHRMVRELPEFLRAGDLLVVNDARVVPARLTGKKQGSGGKVELLLVEPLAPLGAPGSADSLGNAEGPGSEWLALGQSSKPMREGQVIELDGSGGVLVRIAEVRGGGELRVALPPELAREQDVFAFLETSGRLPLPPYIERAPEAADRERYQTLFARVPGAVAAPTAGLHFTPALLEALAARGVERASITLHVGPGTFLPVRAARTEEHKMHRERYSVPPETARAFARARERGGRVVAVGTTALRTLEAAFESAEGPGAASTPGGRDDECAGEEARRAGALRAGPGSTVLFCTPGYQFRAVDALFTNFHLPKSTLLMLVCAFAGTERALAAYRAAVTARYRFFSYGDAMLVM